MLSAHNEASSLLEARTVYETDALLQIRQSNENRLSENIHKLSSRALFEFILSTIMYCLQKNHYLCR